MTVLEFLQSNDSDGLEDVKRLKKHFVAQDHINDKKSREITDRSYIEVMECTEMYSSGQLLELMCKLLDVDDKWMFKQDWKDFIYFAVWIDKQFENIKRLNEVLNADNDEELILKMEQAGASELDIFKYLNVIDDLAQGDILKWKKIEKMPFMTIWTKLFMNKKKAKVQKRLNEIQKAEIEISSKSKIRK